MFGGQLCAPGSPLFLGAVCSRALLQAMHRRCCKSVVSARCLPACDTHSPFLPRPPAPQKIQRRASDISVVSVMPCVRKQGEADRMMFHTPDGSAR